MAVLEPLGMIPSPVESLGRASQPRGLRDRSRERGGEAVDQRPASQPLLGGGRRAMQVLSAVQAVVEAPQRPVHEPERVEGWLQDNSARDPYNVGVMVEES